MSTTTGESLSYYDYKPSKPLAGVVAGLYALSFCVTLYQIIRKRSWVWFVFLFGLLMEVIGYIARILSANDDTKKSLYVIQYVLVILPPVLMTGVIYVVFGRIVFWVVPPESRTIRMLWVPPRFITPLFVGFDAISLTLQLIAAVLISGTDPTEPDAKTKINLGKTLGLVGVSTQIAGFGIFTVSAVRFHFTSRRLNPDFANTNKERHGITRDWKQLLYVVNASCLLILIRSIYRELEFAGGKNGKMHHKEWYLYTFDTLPILLTALIYNIWFPGFYLNRLGFRPAKDHNEFMTSEEAGNSPKAMSAVMDVNNAEK